MKIVILGRAAAAVLLAVTGCAVSAGLAAAEDLSSGSNRGSFHTVSPADPQGQALEFIDVTPKSQFYAPISWVAGQGIATGWVEPNGRRSFRPLEPVSREAMAAFLYRLARSPDFVPPESSPFTDVPVGTQFYKEITWLASKNISSGWMEPDGSKTFRPAQPVYRDANAAFLYRSEGSPEFIPPESSPFSDVALGRQFYKEITWLANTGISSGWTEADGSRTFRPGQPVNRDAMAVFMTRYANLFYPPLAVSA
ncbi:S-layer homology domain-containing protein [Arthrobacter sp. M2012083]|uniref:S-layer homology domain-containing protein n=1 Tax=Arthrobacter sp. M2012083 TaxID=1197706 RepID=UPI00030F1292|nr:S-layer homology domain-containing protein [Arthrobacter sp. M2012083]